MTVSITIHVFSMNTQTLSKVCRDPPVIFKVIIQ